MDKLLGILPYIYFYDEPVQLGDVTFFGVPDWHGRNHAPSAESDRKFLQELSTCFATTRGFSSDRGVVKALTYFLANNNKNTEETFKEARKAITLLRYALLRPDTQALDNVEYTYLYAFELPPAGKGDLHLYHGWVNFNQEIWLSPKHQNFHPPGWYVDFRVLHASHLEDSDQIRECFYNGRMEEPKENRILLALEWYNQSFQKYSFCNIAGRLVDIAVALETLLQLPQQGKEKEFKKRIGQCLGLEGQPVIDQWANDFYGLVHSETLHCGQPHLLLFKHPDAQVGHLSFLGSAQQVFRECVAAETGLPRHIPNDRLLDELTPNEVHLSRLRKAGSFKRIQECGLLEEAQRLRAVYPPGKREDIIWLGKELLRAYKERFWVKGEQSLPTLDLILSARDDDKDLGSKYVQFDREFETEYFTKLISTGNREQMRLMNAIYNFTRFACWALLLPA